MKLSTRYNKIMPLIILLLLPFNLKANVVYKFGVVPQYEPRKLLEIWTPIISALEKKTGLEFELNISSDIPAFESAFEVGKFDFAYMNPFHAVLAKKKQKYEPILRDGESELFGVLVSSKNGTINSIHDLKKIKDIKIAFPAPNALAASLVIRSDLDQKYKLKFEPIWAKTHTSAYLNVVLGKASAAGGVMGTLQKESNEVKDNLKIIYETKKFPTHPIVAHPRINSKIRKKVTDALIEISKTDDGKGYFINIPVKKLVPSSYSDYKAIENMGLEKYYIHGKE